MKAICCQWNMVWEDKPANYKRVRALLDRTAVPGGSLIVLPEMFATGFSMNVPVVQEGSPSETEQFLRDLAKEFDAFVLGGLVSAGAEGRPCNLAVAFSPDGHLLTRYSKIHPFTLGGESACYAAGT